MLHMHTCNATSVQDRQYTALLLLAHGLIWKEKVSTDGRDNALGWIRHVYACIPTWVLKNSKFEAGRITDTRPRI